MGTGPILRRSAILKVHCADTHCMLELDSGLGLGLGGLRFRVRVRAGVRVSRNNGLLK